MGGGEGKVNFHDVLQRSIQAFIIFFLLKSRGKFVFERACMHVLTAGKKKKGAY